MEMGKNMKNIERLLWKFFQYELNGQTINLSKNSQAWYLTISNGVSKKYRDNYIKTLETKVCGDTVEMHTLKDKTIMIGSTATPEDNFLWQEAKVAAEMEELLELQKQVLERKRALAGSLKSLVEANKELPTDSEHYNKYSRKSFDGISA